MVTPSEQLLAAICIATATISAAFLNARTQLKVAREARRSSKPAPPPSKRSLRWIGLGTVVTLGLGWSAATTRQEASGAGGPGFIGAGVTAMLGMPDRGASAGDGGLIVAALELKEPLTDAQAVALLETHRLRPYAVDLRLVGEAEAWRPVPIGVAPVESLRRARATAARAAWMEVCAMESVLASAADWNAPAAPGAAAAADGPALRQVSTDTAALRILRDRAAGARRHAQTLSDAPAVIHALRVLGTAAATANAAQDSAVESAEIVRYDPGWPVQEAAAEPAGDGCEIIQTPTPGEFRPVAFDGSRETVPAALTRE